LNNPTVISLMFLTIFIGLSLSWLVIKTLKEGKEALEEMRRDQE